MLQNEPRIITYVGDRAVAMPLTLPKPDLFACNCQMNIVRLVDGTAHSADVLHSSSGAIYELAETVKRSIYGRVALGYSLIPDGTNKGAFCRSGDVVAIKIYSKAEVQRRAGAAEDAWNEISILHFVKNYKPAVEPPYIPVLDGPNRYPNLVYIIETAEDTEYLYNVMEFIDGEDLCDLATNMIEKGDRFDAETVKNLAKMAGQGLETLHNLGICHRDFSGENLMVTRDQSRIVIIDYGMALRCARDKISGEFLLFPAMGQVGKARYMSPEVFLNACPFDSSKSDMWAMGVVLIVLMTNIPPMELASPTNEAYKVVAKGHLGRLLIHWGFTGLEPNGVQIASDILKVSPSCRLSISEVLNKDWFL